jgi:uncharacterized membrane protein
MTQTTTVQASSGDTRPIPDRPVATSMSNAERMASFVGGAALACYGLRHALGHLALVAGGGAMIYHAVKGNRSMLQGAAASDTQSGDKQQR